MYHDTVPGAGHGTKCNGKRGNVEINNSPQAGIEPGPLDLKSSTLPNELKRYPTSAVLVVVLVNPNHYTSYIFMWGNMINSTHPYLERTVRKGLSKYQIHKNTDLNTI